MEHKKDLPLFLFSFIICVLISVSSGYGLFAPGLYARETENWRSQSIGQDAINLLFVAPFLSFTTLLAVNRSFYGTLLWAGTIVYIIYTYLIYCFNIHFNRFFIDYCLILGLSFYSIVYFLVKEHQTARNIKSTRTTRIMGVYFIFVSLAFCALWLGEIIPSIRHQTVPASIENAGLFTNPIHVLDLSVVLPGIFITGVLVLKSNRIGLLAAPVLLTFFILMDITIGGLILIMNARGETVNLPVVFIMGALTLVSLALLIGYRTALKTTYTE